MKIHFVVLLFFVAFAPAAAARGPVPYKWTGSLTLTTGGDWREVEF